MEKENEKLEYQKMRERIDWAFKYLKEKNLQVSDEALFNQSCEIGRTLFVRSEIAYSSKGG